MKTRDALTDEEMKNGYILICQSLPKGNMVEIKIDQFNTLKAIVATSFNSLVLVLDFALTLNP